MRRGLLLWLIVGWVGWAVLPWYALEDGLLDPGWIEDGWIFDRDAAPALFQGLWQNKP